MHSVTRNWGHRRLYRRLHRLTHCTA
jgi:hypothetical protein